MSIWIVENSQNFLKLIWRENVQTYVLLSEILELFLIWRVVLIKILNNSLQLHPKVIDLAFNLKIGVLVLGIWVPKVSQIV